MSLAREILALLSPNPTAVQLRNHGDADGRVHQPWRHRDAGPDRPRGPGRPPLVQARDAAFTYVMVRVYAPAKRDVAALVANDCWLRLWCNGDLLLSQPLPLDQTAPLIVTLRAGWNTLLAKVSKRESAFSLNFKLTADFDEIARVFDSSMNKNDGSNEADDRLERLYGLVPDLHESWDHRCEPLATLVARRDTVFRRVIAARPKDALLWQERSRYLAALGKWDEALAAYDAMTRDH